MSWPKVKLADCTEIFSGATPRTNQSEYWNGSIPWITPKDLGGYESKYIDRTEKYITDAGFLNCSTNLLPVNSVMMSSRAPIGHVAINTVPMCTNQGFKSLVPNREILEADYLYYWIKANKDFLQNLGVGATFKEISKAIVANIEIPLPPLETQRRIAAILDQADALRQKRQQAIAKLDELVQATFIDMFGDPVTNPKGWPIAKLNDLGNLDRGVSKHRPRGAPELLGGIHPLIQTGDVSRSNGFIKEYSYTYSDVGLKQSKKWPKGTLCITIAANIANTGILDFEACFPDSVVGFTSNHSSNIHYVQGVFSFLREILEETAPQSAQKNINLAILRALDIPKPPIHLQDKWGDIALKIEDQRVAQKKQLAAMETLFKSLQHQAFNGELT